MAGTVTVACKTPHGIFMQLQRQRAAYVNDPKVALIDAGGKQTEGRPWEFYGDRIEIKGFAVRPDGPDDAPKAVRNPGFGLTHNVDADFWASWLEQNKESDLVKNGFIFASAKAADVTDHTKLMKDERCGLEPTDPNNLPNEFKARIKTADVQ